MNSLLPEDKPTFRVHISKMVCSHETRYFVTLDRGDRPENASVLDRIGRINPYSSKELKHVQLEAAAWAEFLGIKVEPFTEID